MMQVDPEHRSDKLALFILAGLVVAVIGGIAFGVFWRSLVPDKGDVLLGSIVTGLILFLRDLVNAVKASWEEVTRTRVTDQLAAGSPSGEPQTVRVDQPADQPIPVETKP